MNPCRRKGDDKNRQFCVSKDGTPYESLCECAKVRVAIDVKEDGRYLRYGMSLSPEIPGQTVRLNDPRLLPDQTIRVVPCYEVFRHLDSRGTRAYRKLFEGKSAFLGCQRLEEALEEEKLINIRPREFETVSWHHIEGTDREPCFSLPSPESFLNSYEEMAGYAIELALNPEKRQIAEEISFESTTLYRAPALSELIRLSPLDINHAMVRRLYTKGIFDFDLKLKTAAFLLTRNIKTKDIIGEILPHYDFEEFKVQKRKVEAIIQKHVPEKLRRLKKAWKKLTTKQRTALKLKYIERLTLEEAARSVQISVDSFRDRLVLAEKKLHEFFPELNRVQAIKEVQKENIAAVKHFNARTGITKRFEILSRKVAPWGPPKKRLNVNKPEIFRWIDEVCPKI